MKRFIIIVILLFAMPTSSLAQQEEKDASHSNRSKQNTKSQPSKVYYGGELGLGFGDYFRISVMPLIGYKVTPQFSVGGKVGYAYGKDKRYSTTIESHNYGGSIFARYRFVQRLYAHTEFVYNSYKYQTERLETEREWVPFLLLGGGYVQPVSDNAVLFVEVLWDVLRDSDSPYDASDPFVKFGIGIGF
ncbi:unnamed protein product [marine sediment metagenome]|uniref:Outer membrane protein beta-barrel domain-containing protein n=1 Tax=marine sediment metagenome TaxID=412755 RepID=X0TB86_9ZZZZ